MRYPWFQIFVRITLVYSSLTSLVNCNDVSQNPVTVKPAQLQLKTTIRGFNPPFLLLSQVQFESKIDANGNLRPHPGDAKLLQLKLTEAGWKSFVLEDPESRVFHKATCIKQENDLRLLTIGATDAHLKTWQWKEGKWNDTSHWNPTFGGKWDRLRDFEFGDVDHDGQDELVIATHDQGLITVATNHNNTFQPKTVFEQENTFIHEIEIGDVDGDKRLEFFATPSAPNSVKSSQGGSVLMFRHQSD